jgi:Family of unknown function (DUF5317)
MSLSLIAALVIALVAGLLRGGSLESLSQTRVRWVILLIEGLLVQLIFDIWDPAGLTSGGKLAVLLISNLSVLAFLLLNKEIPGMILIAFGLLLNTVVITANQAMPVSASAADTAGIEAPTESTDDLKHELLDDDTTLGFLGDVIPVPGVGEVLSVGDIVLALGVGRVVYVQTTGGRRARRKTARTTEASG